jgi:ribokinase
MWETFMQEGQRPVVVVGSINMDLVSRVPQIPRAGETVIGNDFKMYPGGKGANQAVGVARLGYPVMMIGMLGADAFGRQLRTHMQAEGVDMSHVGEVDCASGLATILVDDGGENCIVVTNGANFELTPEVLLSKREVLRGAGLVLAQLEIPMETVECLATLCREFEVPLMLDPAPARTLPQGLMGGTRWITPNETEAQFYVREANGVGVPEEMVLAKLSGMGARGIVLKQGAQGVVLVDGDRVAHRINSPMVRAVDTTAAGDAFNAAFAVGLMQGYDPVKSARFAATAASISVTRAGAQPSMASKQEVSAALEWKQ